VDRRPGGVARGMKRSGDTVDTLPSNPIDRDIPASEARGAKDSRPELRFFTSVLIPAAIVLVILAGLVTGYLEKWLWMGQLHYTEIFWTLFSVQSAMFAAAFAVVFVFMWINLSAVRRGAERAGARDAIPQVVHRLDAAGI
jgi:hypothetical protein